MSVVAERVKKLLIVLIGLFIPDRKRRKHVRHFLRDLEFCDLLTAWRFKKARVVPRTVLLIELNPCHGEVLPGLIEYFRQLNFKVDLVLNAFVADEQPFVRMHEGSYRLFKAKPTAFSFFLKAITLKRYACVVVATTKYYDRLENDPAVTHKFPDLAAQPNLLCMEHDLADVGHFHEESLLQSNRLLTLGRFAQGVMVNSHFFGQIAITPKGTPARFLVIGALGLSRDSAGLIQALLEVKKGTLNFEVVIIGLGALEIPTALIGQVTHKGRVSFKTLFEEVERASFILALLNPENPEHDRYRKTSVTGTAQLSYGFRKPVVIQQAFASTYGFNSTNAVLYEKDFAGGLLAAIQMPQEAYSTMQHELGRLADAIAAESLENLRSSIEADIL